MREGTKLLSGGCALYFCYKGKFLQAFKVFSDKNAILVFAF